MDQLDLGLSGAAFAGAHQARRWIARSRSEPPFPGGWSLRQSAGPTNGSSETPIPSHDTMITSDHLKPPSDTFHSDESERGRDFAPHMNRDSQPSGVAIDATASRESNSEKYPTIHQVPQTEHHHSSDGDERYSHLGEYKYLRSRRFEDLTYYVIQISL